VTAAITAGEDEVYLNPLAAAPPFAWSIEVPTNWWPLDLDPASWEISVARQIERGSDSRTRRSSQRRRELCAAIGELVSAAQRGGILLSYFHIFELPDGTASSAGLNLGWYDSSPEIASLATARRALGIRGVTQTHNATTGPLLLKTDRLSMTPAGSSAEQQLTSFQAMLPVPGSNWTAVVASASLDAGHADGLAELVRHVSESIQIEGAAPPQPPVAAGKIPKRPSTASGIEAGFGTIVRHSIEPRIERLHR
jgi:hypothetical protein